MVPIGSSSRRALSLKATRSVIGPRYIRSSPLLLTTYNEKTLNARGFEVTIHVRQVIGPQIIKNGPKSRKLVAIDSLDSIVDPSYNLKFTYLIRCYVANKWIPHTASKWSYKTCLYQVSMALLG